MQDHQVAMAVHLHRLKVTVRILGFLAVRKQLKLCVKYMQNMTNMYDIQNITNML